MDVREPLSSVRFRFLQPRDRVPWMLRLLLQRRFTLLQRFLDWMNAALPQGDAGFDVAQAACAHVPRMSTATIGWILRTLLRHQPPDAMYLNIGVWHGYSFLMGIVDQPERPCVGVDAFVEFDRPRDAFLSRFQSVASDRHAFHMMDWREYFRSVHQGNIGVYYYDAGHDEESQYEALVSAHPFIIPGGFAIVDDWNWSGPQRGTERFLREHPEYELILDQPTSCNCHPTFWNGIAVLRKCS